MASAECDGSLYYAHEGLYPAYDAHPRPIPLSPLSPLYPVTPFYPPFYAPLLLRPPIPSDGDR